MGWLLIFLHVLDHDTGKSHCILVYPSPFDVPAAPFYTHPTSRSSGCTHAFPPFDLTSTFQAHYCIAGRSIVCIVCIVGLGACPISPLPVLK